jgi:hypothetical protein
MTTNLAMPGFGSLLAGRAVGYFQIPFTVIGFGLTVLCGIPTIIWYFSNWSRLQQMQEEPDGYARALGQLWIHLRWPLLGIGLFFFALLWALTSSLGIMAQARAAELTKLTTLPPPLPPKLR